MLPLEVLSSILDAVPEPIEVADSFGNIIFVNKAFSEITNMPAEKHINQNIFKVSPDGILAQALSTGKAVTGQRLIVGGNKIEVVANAYPIITDGKLKGAVLVFQQIKNFMSIIEDLRKSNFTIENLSNKYRQVTSSKYTFNDIIAASNEMKQAVTDAQHAAKSDTPILLLGECGTEKEIFAHAIHSVSNRSNRPFITVNCAAVADDMLESELFGTEKGAFNTAEKDKIGQIELANGGTIFLDEIGALNAQLQFKLLRFLQESTFQRVGGVKPIKANVRIIAATAHNIRRLIRNGKFREDLFYRLNVIEINIPPLRKRKCDIEPLCNTIIKKLNRKLGKRVKGLSPNALLVLQNYRWPGNVKELYSVLERVMLTSQDEYLTADSLKPYLVGCTNNNSIDIMPIDKMEKILIIKALETYGMSMTGKRQAASTLNISLATLYNKIKKYNIPLKKIKQK